MVHVHYWNWWTSQEKNRDGTSLWPQKNCTSTHTQSIRKDRCQRESCYDKRAKTKKQHKKNLIGSIRCVTTTVNKYTYVYLYTYIYIISTLLQKSWISLIMNAMMFKLPIHLHHLHHPNPFRFKASTTRPGTVVISETFALGVLSRNDVLGAAELMIFMIWLMIPWIVWKGQFPSTKHLEDQIFFSRFVTWLKWAGVFYFHSVLVK